MFKTIAWIALLLAASAAPGAVYAGAQAVTTPQASQQQKQSDAEAAATSSYRITGRVVNSLTNTPVGGAYVLIASASNPNFNRTMRTGPDGGFVFTQIHAGRYAMTARRKGYVEQMYLQHEQYTTAILVGPNLDSENLIFPLPPEGVISGEVTDEAGEPVRNAAMILLREYTAIGEHAKHFEERLNTDEDGRYRFRRLLAGNYYLAVSAEPWYAQYARNEGRFFSDEGGPGAQESGPRNSSLDLVYPITYYPNATDASGAAPIRVEAGGSSRADMRLVPVRALHMRVEVNGANPGTFTRVQVLQKILGVYDDSSKGTTHQVGSRHASEDGEDGGDDRASAPYFVELGGLRPGPAVVQVLTGEAGGTWQPSVSKSVAVDPTDGQTLDVRGVASAGLLSRTVKLEGGAPAPLGARVLLGLAGKGPSWRANAEVDGSFRFTSKSLEPGTYEVFAAAPGGLEFRSMSATGAKVTGHKVEIGSEGNVQLIVTLARGVNGRVKGIVELAGRPVAGWMVVLVPENLADTGAYRRDQSDSDGSFSLNAVWAGKYTVIAVKDWELEWAKPEVIRKYLAGGESVEVAGGEERKVTVVAK